MTELAFLDNADLSSDAAATMAPVPAFTTEQILAVTQRIADRKMLPLPKYHSTNELNYFRLLPRELLLEILSRVRHFSSLLGCRLVCRTWEWLVSHTPVDIQVPNKNTSMCFRLRVALFPQFRKIILSGSHCGLADADWQYLHELRSTTPASTSSFSTKPPNRPPLEFDLSDFTNTTHLRDHCTTLQRLKFFASALVFAHRYLELDISNPSAQNLVGVMYVENVRLEEALQYYNKAIELGSSHVFWNNRGRLYLGLGRHEDALDDFDQSLRMAPRNPTALKWRAACFEKQKLFHDAIREYEKALEVEPDCTTALNGRGLAYLGLGMDEDALKDFNVVVKQAPSNPVCRHNRGMVLERLGRWDEALADVDSAISLNARNGQYWYSRGKIHDAMKRWPEAVGDFEKALEIDPTDIASLYRLGKVLDQLGRKEEALTIFNTVLISPLPSFARHWNAYGCVLQHFNRHREAVERFNRAMQMQPNVVDYHRHRAKSLAALGRLDEALSDYARAVQLKPHDPVTRTECERLRDLVAQRAAASAAVPE